MRGFCSHFAAFLAFYFIVRNDYSEASNCNNLQANQTDFEVDFWSFFPYTVNNETNSNTKRRVLLLRLLKRKENSAVFLTKLGKTGLFNVLIDGLKETTHLKIKWNPEQEYEKILNKSTTASNPNLGPANTMVLPIMKETNVNDPCFAKVYQSSGFAFVVRRNVKKPLNQLAGSFINGGQVIGLTLILTGIAGICMWLLDRRINPVDFPPSFLRGSWQGFWWAFVTMTTVGYGDLAPKSVPGRIFSILWMLLGLVAFSVLTANFTSSLAREIETDLNLFNKKIAVFKGDIGRKAVIDLGAQYMEFLGIGSDNSDMIKALKDRKVEGLLLDKHFVISDKMIIQDDSTIEIGKMIDYKFMWGLQLIMQRKEMCAAVKTCIENFVSEAFFQNELADVLSSSVILKDEEKGSGSLFEDYEFFIILIALFSVMTGGGVLWEYIYYNPRLIKKNQIEEDAEMQASNSLKFIITNSEADDLCEDCNCKVVAIHKKEGDQRLERMRKMDKKEGSYKGSSLKNKLGKVIAL